VALILNVFYNMKKLFLISICSAFFSCYANNDKISTTSNYSINTSFGKPTYIQTLYYLKMYDKKPYHDAILFYYSNGMYKIISPGEEHYGTYVVKGSFKDKKYSVYYMALPSSDWGNKTAYLHLQYNNVNKTFTQQTLLFTQEKVPNEYGAFKIKDNNQANPLNIK